MMIDFCHHSANIPVFPKTSLPPSCDESDNLTNLTSHKELVLTYLIDGFNSKNFLVILFSSIMFSPSVASAFAAFWKLPVRHTAGIRYRGTLKFRPMSGKFFLHISSRGFPIHACVIGTGRSVRSVWSSPCISSWITLYVYRLLWFLIRWT